MKQDSMLRILSLIIIAAIVVFLSGCRTPLPKDTINIPEAYKDKMTTKADGSGLRSGWANIEAIKKYNRIMLNSKLSSPMYKNTWWENDNVRRLFYSQKEDTLYVENYMTTAFNNALANSQEFQAAIFPGDQTMTMNVYLTQVVANKIILGTLANFLYPSPIGLILIPIKLAVQSSMGNQGGSVSVEIVITDSQTGGILAVLASREKGPTAVFDSNRFFAYANVRNIINIWSCDVISMLDQIKEGVQDPKPPKVIPSWLFIRIIAD